MKIYSHFNEIPEIYNIIYSYKDSLNGQPKYATTIGDIAYLLKDQNTNLSENEYDDLENPAEADDIVSIAQIEEFLPLDFAVWKLERANGKVTVLENSLNTYDVDFQAVLQSEEQIQDHEKNKIHISSYREQLITFSSADKIVNFGNYLENEFSLNHNNETIFNPQISFKSKKLPVLVLKRNLPNVTQFSNQNLKSVLSINTQIKTGLMIEEVADQKVNALTTSSLYELAKAEGDYQDIYGKNLVYLLKGSVKYSKFDRKQNKNIYLYAPLFLVPIRTLRKIKLDPFLEFEDYAILNFVFDKNIDFQISNFFGGQKRFNLEDVNENINRLQGHLNEFIEINGVTIIEFISQSYISSISGFNNVYLDKAWDQIEKSDKVKKLINLDFGKEVQSDSGLKSMTPLDPSQEKAMKYALIPDNELTVIKGPPGTGKSQVIVSILSQIIKQNKKALFVSSKKVALHVITKKIKEFESDLDRNNNKDGDQENLRSLNDRILDLTSPSVRYNNYLSNAVQAIENKGSYFYNYLDYKNDLHSYPDIIRKKEIANLINTETQYQNQPIKEYGLLSQMMRHKILSIGSGYTHINLDRTVDLSELKDSVKELSDAGFEKFNKHCFTTLNSDSITEILNILKDFELSSFAWNQKLDILDPTRSIDDVVTNCITLLESLSEINIDHLFLAKNRQLSILDYLRKLKEYVELINKFQTATILNLNSTNNNLISSITEFGESLDLKVVADVFDFEIPIIQFYEKYDELNKVVSDINGIYRSLLPPNVLIKDLKAKIAEVLLINMTQTQRYDFKNECQIIFETLENLRHNLQSTFLVSDLDILVDIRNILDSFAVTDTESFATITDSNIESLMQFQGFTQKLINHGFGNVSLETYENIYQTAIKNQKYNFLNYPFSTFKKETKKNNIQLSLKLYKSIDFINIPKLFLLPIFRQKTITEIANICSNVLSKKVEFDTKYKQISDKIDINKLNNILQIFPKQVLPAYNTTIQELKRDFGDLNLSSLSEFLSLVLEIDLVAIFGQNSNFEVSSIFNFYKNTLDQNFVYLPQNSSLNDLNNWITQYKEIITRFQTIINSDPGFYDKNDTVKSFLYKISNLYYRVQLRKLTPSSKEEAENHLHKPENILTSFDLSIFDNIQDYIVILQQLNQVNKQLKSFEYTRSGFKTIYQFNKYLQEIKESEDEYQAYCFFLESQENLIYILGENNYDILKNQAKNKGLTADQFERFVINSVLNTVGVNDIGWLSNDSHGLLNEYKNFAEQGNYKAYLEARFYDFENSLSDIISILNRAEREGVKTTRNKLSDEKIFNRLAKCFSIVLATPGDVSNFIPANENLFDYVIFDEASQVMIGEALPSIYRGKKIIVVGDPDQMPPSSFSFNFNGRVIADTDEKSIVDLCLASGSHDWKVFDLQVHYRSKHPALFESSRSVIYPNTKQLVMAHNYKPLLRAELIEKNDYKSFVDYVNRNIETDQKTYGIICMRADDQIAIQKMIDRPEIIVRALENMQGDEADEIFIFLNYNGSVGFKLAKNVWGQGGYKRLNVALTRARQRIHLVHNIPLKDIRTTAIEKEDGGDNSKSAKLLQKFVDLIQVHNPEDQDIENGLLSINQPKPNLHSFESPLEKDFYYIFNDVLSKIDSNRFKLIPQVAEGYFRIDFGVYDTKQNKYILGIELDGAMYHSDLEQIFYDSRRQKTLEAMGWQIYRIWSSDWFNSPEEEVEKLKSRINQIFNTL